MNLEICDLYEDLQSENSRAVRLCKAAAAQCADQKR